MIRFFTDESPSRDEGISCEGGETIKETNLRVRNSPYSGITMTRIRTRYPRAMEFHASGESCARLLPHRFGNGAFRQGESIVYAVMMPTIPIGADER
jgi:hypothetical protein